MQMQNFPKSKRFYAAIQGLPLIFLGYDLMNMISYWRDRELHG